MRSRSSKLTSRVFAIMVITWPCVKGTSLCIALVNSWLKIQYVQHTYFLLWIHHIKNISWAETLLNSDLWNTIQQSTLCKSSNFKSLINMAFPFFEWKGDGKSVKNIQKSSTSNDFGMLHIPSFLKPKSLYIKE